MRYVDIKKAVIHFCSIMLMFCLCLSSAHAVYINEIHYDNTGSDVGEGVELAGTAGQDLSGWSLLFYNGSNDSVYKNYALSGIFTDMQQGLGVLSFAISGLQNGGEDGIALVDDGGAVQQFLSYEGSLTAISGAALGMTSSDIGVAENGSTPVGSSLQLFGSGQNYADFTWGVATQTFGSINAGQTFVMPARTRVNAVPEPASSLLLLLGLLMLVWRYLVTGRRSCALPA